MRVTTDWFPMVLGTMVLSLTSWIDYTIFNVNVAYYVGKAIYFVALALLFVLLVLWLSGYTHLRNVKEDLSSIQRISFTAFLAVLIFVSGFFYTVYVSSSPASITWLSYAFFAGFFLALAVNVLTWVKIYLSQGVTLGYGLLVPSIALSADVVLGAPILPPFSNVLKDVTLIYGVMLFSLGVTTIQFLFLGSASLMSHIQGNKAYPAVMIPLGAASIIGINVLSFPAYNYLGFVEVPVKVALGVGISLFGFEVWNLIVGFVIAVKRVKDPPSLISWAYVFPVGISMFSAFMLYQETGFPIFSWFVIALNIAVVALYLFSALNTVRFVRMNLDSAKKNYMDEKRKVE